MLIPVTQFLISLQIRIEEKIVEALHMSIGVHSTMFWKQFTRWERNSIGILAIVAFALRIPLAFRSERMLTALPYCDDAYYMFSIARNLAKGLGATWDGTHLTNGFQPLIVFLYTPLFAIAGNDSWLAIRYSFILNGIIAASSVWVLAAAVRSLEKEPRTSMSIPLLAATLWTFSILLFLNTTNGMETGLYSLLILIVIKLYADHISDLNRWGRCVLLGIVLGLTILARIDAAILVAILFAVESIQKRWRAAIIIAGIAFLISLPWWYYNLHYFGSLMPISGQAEQSWPDTALENFQRTLQALLDIALVVIYVPDKFAFGIRIVIAIIVICTIIWAVRKLHIVSFFKLHVRSRALQPFVIFGVVLLIYYSIFFGAPHFIARYLQPMRVLWIILVAFAAPLLIAKVRVSRQFTRSISILVVCGVLGFGACWYYVSCYIGRNTHDFYEMGQFALQHPQDKFGMLQSGIAGFVATNVINLDGKVNAEALHAHLAGHLGKYIDSVHCTYLADENGLIQDLAALAKKDELSFDSVGMVGSVHVMKLRAQGFNDSNPYSVRSP